MWLLANNLTRSPVSVRAFQLVLVFWVLVGVGALLSPAGAFAVEGERPTINNVTDTKVYEHEGTVEAQIDPRGSETTYEMWLECQSAREPFWPCEPISNSQRIQGDIASGVEPQTVSLHLTGLQPGSHYWYGIVAANSAGKTESRGQILIDPVIPLGACPTGCSSNEQYSSEIPGWYNELGNSQSAQTLKEYEEKHAKELEAAHAKEQEEQRAEEAANTAQAAELKSRKEEEEMDTGSVRLASTGITVKSGHLSLVELECFGSSPCAGKLKLVGKVTNTSKGMKHIRKATIGTASFSVRGDAAAVVRIDMNAVGRALLRASRGHLRAILRIEEIPLTADSTQTETVYLAQEKPQARSKTN